MHSEVTALIIDDEIFAREAIKVYLKKHNNVKVLQECSNGLEGINAIHNLKPDLVFLDIQMPELNGFELLEEMDLQQPPCIIFTSAFDNFALKAFEVNAVDYLLKPFNQQRFDASLNKALYHLEGRKRKQSTEVVEKLLEAYKNLSGKSSEGHLVRILIKEPKKYFFVKVEDIQWLEASGDYVTLHTESKTHLINDSLNNLESKLNTQKFFRIHRSSIVNVDFIKEFEPHLNGEFHIILKNGTKLKLSRTYKDAARQLFGA